MQIFRQLGALALVFALLWAALRLLRGKAWRPRSAPTLLESQGKLALTARHSVHLIRVGDRTLIVGVYPEGITFLGDGASSHTDAAAIGSATT